MEYRKLGRYGVRLSTIGLGGWLTHGGSLDLTQTTQMVHKAVDLGINFFDTADAYKAGEAETALGQAIDGLKRESLVLATKCYFPITEEVNDKGLSRKHIVESVHKSLKRLGTDYIDIMQFHRYDADTPLDETVRAIDDLIRQGKVLYWGVSQWTAAQITDAAHIAKELNANPPASDQPRYSMLFRDLESSILPTCEQFGLGVVVYSPLAQGVLTGKYKPGQPAPEGTRAADNNSNQFMLDLLNDRTLTRVQNLQEFAKKQGYELSQFALAWTLRKKSVTSAIIGATSIEQLEANASASDIALDSSVWEQAEAILAGSNQ